ncbi:MAG: hypothetical protein DME07_12055 [Candidatus Rokuibacteriota bacterium]|nr:MAG: hypothetical protein DME07_12055 [Candidatus Rokubacteria bacterium]PYN53442.1 MAG: hypothetical protein DMD94_18415 [Candidatus Rokubacteria bacterium]
MRFGWLTLAHSASPEADYAHVHDLVEQAESSPEPTRQSWRLECTPEWYAAASSSAERCDHLNGGQP